VDHGVERSFAAKVAEAAISKAVLTVLLYIAYGLTNFVLYLQWTGLPVSSEPQDPERLRPSILIMGSG